MTCIYSILKFERMPLRNSRFISDEYGATAIEYVFIVAVVGFGLILAMANLGPVFIAFAEALDEIFKKFGPT